MKLHVNILKPTNYYHAKFEFERFSNGKAVMYFDVETEDGYNLFSELSESKQSIIATIMIESLTGSSIEYLSKIANTCRTENENPKLSSMLRELDSTLQELIDYQKEDSNKKSPATTGPEMITQ